MFDLFIGFDNIEISSIERNDIEEVYEWIKFKNNNNRINLDLTIEDLYERFIEYYVSECEFFSKVMIDSKISGIVKGRIEFRNPNEVWLACLFLDSNIRNKGIGSDVVKEVINHFHNEYGIKNFYASIMNENDASLTFWKDNGFNLLRVVKNFYDLNERKEDMFVLGKFI